MPERISVIHNIITEYTYDDFGEDDMFVTDERGFSCMFDPIVTDLKEWGCEILLGKYVSKINYLTGNVSVVFSDAATGSKEELNVD